MHMSKAKYNTIEPNYNLVTSVIGFDFDAYITYVNEVGEEVELCKGCTTIPYTGVGKPIIGTIVPLSYHKIFTNFNQELLDKIRDYRSKNT